MKIIPIIIVFFITIFSAAAQKLDSIHHKNGKLYYHEYGQGEAIILLAGGPGNNCSQLEDVATKLSKNNHVILLEQRGTGRSIPKPFDSTTINLSTAVEDINLLLNKLELKQAIICGHSWGACLAMYFASFFPEKIKALILLNPGPLFMGEDLLSTFNYNASTRFGIDELKMLESLVVKFENKTVTPEEMQLVERIQRQIYLSDKTQLDSLIGKINVPTNEQTQSLIFSAVFKSKVDFRNSLEKLNKPVYMVCGRQDFMSYASYELKIAYPEFELFWIQNSGHFPMYEQPEKFYSLMDKIMNQINK